MKFLLLGLILVLGTLAVIRPISADQGVTITNSGNITVLAGQSGSTTITFHEPSAPYPIVSVTVSCTGLPAGAVCSTNPPAATLLGLTFSDGGTFQVVVSTSPSTPPGTYPITVTALFGVEIPTIIQPWIPASTGGSIGLKSVSIQQDPVSGSASTTFNLIVNALPLPTPIPEYPLGLPILAILTVIAYGVIRRKTITKQK